MPAPTRRSKAERALYYEDHTLPRSADNVQKVVKLDAPQRIQDHPEKLDAWNYICNDLASRQLLSPSYIMDITLLVDNMVQYEELRQTLEDTGPITPVMDKTGEKVVKYVENPLFSMVKRVEAVVMKLCEKFGLNPRDAVYVANPDIKTQAIDSTASDPKKGITYFQ